MKRQKIKIKKSRFKSFLEFVKKHIPFRKNPVVNSEQNRKIKLAQQSRRKYLLILGSSIFVFALGVGLFAAKPFLISRIPIHKPKSIVKPFDEDDSLQNFEHLLSEKGISLQNLMIATDGATITGITDDGTQIELNRYSDPQWQIDTLQELLQRLTIDNKQPKSIDLEYDKPIVSY